MTASQTESFLRLGPTKTETTTDNLKPTTDDNTFYIINALKTQK